MLAGLLTSSTSMPASLIRDLVLAIRSRYSESSKGAIIRSFSTGPVGRRSTSGPYDGGGPRSKARGPLQRSGAVAVVLF